jgi:urease gamma subunit
VHPTPREVDKLLIFSAGELARTRRACGLELNHSDLVSSEATGVLPLAQRHFLF